MIFSWDDANEDHLAKHGVVPSEAEHVVQSAERPFPTVTRGGRLRVWGSTWGGRLLQVVFMEVPDDEVDPMSVDLMAWVSSGQTVVRIIHARDLTRAERQLYGRIRPGR